MPKTNIPKMIMSIRSLLRYTYIVWLMALVLALFPQASIARKKHCPPSSCGNIGNISYPFHLKGHNSSCGDGRHELACDNNHTILETDSGVKYYVQHISYENQRIRLVDFNMDTTNSCSIPPNSFPFSEFRYGYYYLSYSVPSTFFVSCSNPVNALNYIDFSSCNNRADSSYSYVVLSVTSPFDIAISCTVNAIYPFIPDLGSNLTISHIHHQLLRGFWLLYYQLDSFFCGYGYFKGQPTWIQVFRRVKCFVLSLIYYLIYYPNSYTYRIPPAGVYIIIGRIAIGFLCLIVFAYRFRRTLLSFDDLIENFLQSRNNFMPMRLLRLIILLAYGFRRRLLSIDEAIENFLQSQNNFMPIRYSYSDIKQMTNNFRDKLGQGGYGSVFKGKLRSGDFVAVKVLGMSKANGQDFISEVATIGRIHHVNVVRMIGFCVEGAKRALIYEFMPNGSLDKIIFSRGEESLPFISWERMHDIAVGVARGIDYLHRGCDMQILHFDIKPHNILLDQGLVPKVSDFGLAKLYPTDDSIVPLTAARGTFGYIAPELFYKNIGGVSYKADVYSFGMLLMEMVGKRKNTKPHAEHESQIYFPYWIYDHINEGDDLQSGDVIEEEKSYVRKMIITALWCIQLRPVDRPSMNEVLQMLEGEEEMLQMPPKPFLYSNNMSNPTNIPIGVPTSSHAEMSITMEDMLR